jgi:hypothetical protein
MAGAHPTQSFGSPSRNSSGQAKATIGTSEPQRTSTSWPYLSESQPPDEVTPRPQDRELHRSGVKQFHHGLVGELTRAYGALELPCDAGQRINVYTAEPASPSAEALALLAGWTATPTAQSVTEAQDAVTPDRRGSGWRPS